MVRCRERWVEDGAAECRWVYRQLAEHRGTFVVPASGFELPDTYFRVGFGGDPIELKAGLDQLAGALSDLDDHRAAGGSGL